MSTFATSFKHVSSVVRDDRPLSDDQIRRAVPSIYAEEPHHSRSHRYGYIPTSQVLAGLRKEGFQPFFACQTRVKIADKAPFTKHMLRLRHASQIGGADATEANEIILINSHDGSSAYQMLAGVFRFICTNGLICGDEVGDIRVPHRGDVVGRVIEGAYTVLDEFKRIDDNRQTMKEIPLTPPEQTLFARAALVERFGEDKAPPVTTDQVLAPERWEDRGSDLWTVFNRTQEHLVRGGLRAHTANNRRTRTRAVTGIDQNVKLNRGLWMLAEGMRKLKEGGEI
jgi:hypothetical protein